MSFFVPHKKMHLFEKTAKKHSITKTFQYQTHGLHVLVRFELSFKKTLANIISIVEVT